MEHRKLRIAWSVGWALLCFLLAAAWERTRRHTDVITIPLAGQDSAQIISCCGNLAIILAPYTGEWHLQTLPADQFTWRKGQYNLFRFYNSVPRMGNRHEWAVSYSLLLALTAGLAATPWCIRVPRFNLRTLLIATTLVAVGLGMIVWLAGTR